jgi:hypothetical protein
MVVLHLFILIIIIKNKKINNFINDGESKIFYNQNTYGRMYLITEDQFLDILIQENGISPSSLDIDFKLIKKNKQYKLNFNGFYNTILYLGNDEGFPIFTFTNDENNFYSIPFTKPSYEYIKVISNGLKVNFANENIIKYFLKIPGICDNYNLDTLKHIINSF